MWIVGTDGSATMLSLSQDGTFGFPTWSPDGSRIAAVQGTPGSSAVVVLDVPTSGPVAAAKPRVIFRSASSDPFYLSWTPDGTKVSFLANDADGLALRIAPADGSAPLDGSGLGAVIRTGNPLYFDWLDPTHLFAHIGTGNSAFLGEIGTDGATRGSAIATPGDFRNPDVSADGRFVAYVRRGASGVDAIVVSPRDGSVGPTMPVDGIAAVDFSPTDDVVATIGAVTPSTTPAALPIGPLRLMDARTGAMRTLLDGSVVSFFWSPDGSTIAAVHVVAAGGGSTVSFITPVASTATSGGGEIRVAFIDVASGTIRSDQKIVPAQTFVGALLPYFDQYALSHRLWAPDSSSLLVPEDDDAGTTHLDVLFPSGGPRVALDGGIGFWSPR